MTTEDTQSFLVESGRALAGVAGREPLALRALKVPGAGGDKEPDKIPPDAGQVVSGYDAHIALINEFTSPLVFNSSVAYEHGDEYNISDTYLAFAQDYADDEQSRQRDEQHAHTFSPGRFELATSLQPFVDEENKLRILQKKPPFDPTVPVPIADKKNRRVWKDKLAEDNVQTASLFLQLNGRQADTLVSVGSELVPMTSKQKQVIIDRRPDKSAAMQRQPRALVLPALGDYNYSRLCVRGLTEPLTDLRESTRAQLEAAAEVVGSITAADEDDLAKKRVLAYAAIEKALLEYDDDAENVDEASYGIIRFHPQNGGYYIRDGLQVYALDGKIVARKLKFDDFVERRPTIRTPYIEEAKRVNRNSIVAAEREKDEQQEEQDDLAKKKRTRQSRARTSPAERQRQLRDLRDQYSRRNPGGRYGPQAANFELDLRYAARNVDADVAERRPPIIEKFLDDVQEIDDVDEDQVANGPTVDDLPALPPSNDAQLAEDGEVVEDVDFDAESPLVFGDDLGIYGHVLVRDATASTLAKTINTEFSSDRNWKVVAGEILKLAVYYKMVPELYSVAFGTDASDWLVGSVLLIRGAVDRATRQLLSERAKRGVRATTGALAKSEQPTVFWLTISSDLAAKIETSRQRAKDTKTLIAAATETRDLTMRDRFYPTETLLLENDRILALLDQFADNGRWETVHKHLLEPIGVAANKIPLDWSLARSQAIVEQPPVGWLVDNFDRVVSQITKLSRPGDPTVYEKKHLLSAFSYEDMLEILDRFAADGRWETLRPRLLNEAIPTDWSAARALAFIEQEPTGWLIEYFDQAVATIEQLCDPSEHNEIGNIVVPAPGTATAYVANVIAAAATQLGSNSFAEALYADDSVELSGKCEDAARLSAALHDTNAHFTPHGIVSDFVPEGTATDRYVARRADDTVAYDATVDLLRRQLYNQTHLYEWRALEYVPEQLGNRRIEVLYLLTPERAIDWCERGIRAYSARSDADPKRKTLIPALAKGMRNALTEADQGRSARLASYYKILDNLVKAFAAPSDGITPIYNSDDLSLNSVFETSLYSFWVDKQPVMQIDAKRTALRWATTLPFGALPCAAGEVADRTLQLVWLGLATERRWLNLGFTNIPFNLPVRLGLPRERALYRNYRALLAALDAAYEQAEQKLMQLAVVQTNTGPSARGAAAVASLLETDLLVERLELSVRTEMQYVHAGRTMWFEDTIIHTHPNRWADAVAKALYELATAVKQRRYIAAINYRETALAALVVKPTAPQPARADVRAADVAVNVANGTIVAVEPDAELLAYDVLSVDPRAQVLWDVSARPLPISTEAVEAARAAADGPPATIEADDDNNTDFEDDDDDDDDDANDGGKAGAKLKLPALPKKRKVAKRTKKPHAVEKDDSSDSSDTDSDGDSDSNDSDGTKDGDSDSDSDEAEPQRSPFDAATESKSSLHTPVGSHKQSTARAVELAQSFFEDTFAQPIRNGILPEVLALDEDLDEVLKSQLDLIYEAKLPAQEIERIDKRLKAVWSAAFPKFKPIGERIANKELAPFPQIARTPGFRDFRDQLLAAQKKEKGTEFTAAEKADIAAQQAKATLAFADRLDAAVSDIDRLPELFARILGDRIQPHIAKIPDREKGEISEKERISAYFTPREPGEQPLPIPETVDNKEKVDAAAHALFDLIGTTLNAIFQAFKTINALTSNYDRLVKEKADENKIAALRAAFDAEYEKVLQNPEVAELMSRGTLCGLIETAIEEGASPFDGRIPETIDEIFKFAANTQQAEYRQIFAMRERTRLLAMKVRALLGNAVSAEVARKTVTALREQLKLKDSLAPLLRTYPLDDTLRRLLLAPAIERARVALYQEFARPGRYELAYRADVPQALRINELVENYCLRGWMPFEPRQSTVYDEFMALRDERTDSAVYRDALALSPLLAPELRNFEGLERDFDDFRVTDGAHHQLPFGADLILSALWLRLMRLYLSVQSNERGAPQTVGAVYLETLRNARVRTFTRDVINRQPSALGRITVLLQLIFAPRNTLLNNMAFNIDFDRTKFEKTVACVPPLDELRPIDVRAIGALVFGVDFSALRGRDGDETPYRVEIQVDRRTGAPVIDPGFIYRRGIAAKEVLVDTYYRAVLADLYRSDAATKPAVVYALSRARLADEARFIRDTIDRDLNAREKYESESFLPLTRNAIFSRTEFDVAPSAKNNNNNRTELLFDKKAATEAYGNFVFNRRFEVTEPEQPLVRLDNFFVRLRTADFQPAGEFHTTSSLGEAVRALQPGGQAYLSATRTLFTAMARSAASSQLLGKDYTVYEASWHYVPRCVLVAALFRMYNRDPNLRLLIVSTIDMLVRKIDNGAHLLYDDVEPPEVPLDKDTQLPPALSIDISTNSSVVTRLVVPNVRPTAISAPDEYYGTLMAIDTNDANDVVDPRRGRRARTESADIQFSDSDNGGNRAAAATGAIDLDYVDPDEDIDDNLFAQTSMQTDARAALSEKAYDLPTVSVGELVKRAALNNTDRAGWLAYVETRLAAYLLGRGLSGSVRLLPLGDIAAPLPDASLLEYESQRLYGSEQFLPTFVASTLLPILQGVGDGGSRPLQTLLRSAEQWRIETFAAATAAATAPTGTLEAVRSAQALLDARRRADAKAPNWAELLYDALAQHFELQTRSQTIEQLMRRYAATNDSARLFMQKFYASVVASKQLRHRPSLGVVDLQTVVPLPTLLQLMLLDARDSLVRDAQLHPLMPLLVAPTTGRPLLRFVSRTAARYQTLTDTTGLVYPGDAHFTGAEIVASLAKLPAAQLDFTHEFIPLSSEPARLRREFVIVSRIERRVAAPAVDQSTALALYYQTLAPVLADNQPTPPPMVRY
jgi:hypothetical protein